MISADTPLRRIREAHAEPAHRVRIIYTDGPTITVDLTDMIRQGGVFAPLADPDFFARVAVALWLSNAPRA